MEAGEPQQDGSRQRIAVTLGIATLALAGIVALALVAGSSSEPSGFEEGSVPAREIADLDRAVEASGCTATNEKSEGRIETGENVDYEADPPHSGDHAPEPAEDAAYRTDAPPDENLVHTLFHGRILMWFKEELGDEAIGNLKALYDEDPNHVLLVRRDSMDVPVAATAWKESLTCPEMNDQVFDAIRAFRDTYRDNGPEFVP
jgi:hypothetical protein